MDWTRSDTLALAMHNCAQCHGAGLRLARKGALAPCNCVLRAIFRICYDRFLRCVTQEKHLSRVSLEPHAGRSRPSTWGRKDEEYIADFTLIPSASLTSLSRNCSAITFCWARTGNSVPASYTSTGGISSMLSIGLSKNSDALSGN